VRRSFEKMAAQYERLAQKEERRLKAAMDRRG
jgi:hypothetical protein